jgi:hypothetical protein
MHCATLYLLYSVLDWTGLPLMVLHCMALCCITVNCTVLHGTALYRTVLYCAVRHEVKEVINRQLTS